MAGTGKKDFPALMENPRTTNPSRSPRCRDGLSLPGSGCGDVWLLGSQAAHQETWRTTNVFSGFGCAFSAACLVGWRKSTCSFGLGAWRRSVRPGALDLRVALWSLHLAAEPLAVLVSPENAPYLAYAQAQPKTQPKPSDCRLTQEEMG